MLRNDRNVIYFGNKVVRQWTVAAGIVERSPVRVHQITPGKLVNNSLDESWEWCFPPARQPASLRCLIRGDQSVVRMSHHAVEDHWAGVDNLSANKINSLCRLMHRKCSYLICSAELGMKCSEDQSWSPILTSIL